MALMTIDEYGLRAQSGADYRFKGFAVHSDQIAGMLTNKTEEKIGTVADVLIDDAGQVQYIIIDLGTMPSGRQVSLPADRARIDRDRQIIFASGITKEQAEQLPQFTPEMRG